MEGGGLLGDGSVDAGGEAGDRDGAGGEAIDSPVGLGEAGGVSQAATTRTSARMNGLGFTLPLGRACEDACGAGVATRSTGLLAEHLAEVFVVRGLVDPEDGFRPRLCVLSAQPAARPKSTLTMPT